MAGHAGRSFRSLLFTHVTARAMTRGSGFPAVISRVAVVSRCSSLPTSGPQLTTDRFETTFTTWCWKAHLTPHNISSLVPTMLARVAVLLLAVTSVLGARPDRSLLQQSPQGAAGDIADGAQADVTNLFSLPYSTDALEPYIDNLTTTLHWTRHSQSFFTQLGPLIGNNTQLANYNLADLQRLAGTDILSGAAATSLINNGGGAWNHAFFFKSLTPPGTFQAHFDQAASQHLKDAITYSFGDFSTFQRNFSTAAASVFGSGWAWLVATDEGLKITTTPNQNNPLQTNLANSTRTIAGIPVLGIDVWEHAYYLKHYNVRANYISNFFYVINWAQISDNYMYAAAGRVPSTAFGPLATSFPVAGSM